MVRRGLLHGNPLQESQIMGLAETVFQKKSTQDDLRIFRHPGRTAYVVAGMFGESVADEDHHPPKLLGRVLVR